MKSLRSLSLAISAFLFWALVANAQLSRTGPHLYKAALQKHPWATAQIVGLDTAIGQYILTP